MNVVVGRLGCRKTALIGAFLLSLSSIFASVASQLTLLIFLQAALLGESRHTLVSRYEAFRSSLRDLQDAILHDKGVNKQALSLASFPSRLTLKLSGRLVACLNYRSKYARAHTHTHTHTQTYTHTRTHARTHARGT